MYEKFVNPETRKNDQKDPPFDPSLFDWREEDYEAHLKDMADLPCIQGHELFGRIMQTMSTLDTYYKHTYPDLWKPEHATFNPRQVFLRYDGKPWDYSFHETRRRIHLQGDEPHAGRQNSEQLESTIISVAKMLVQQLTRLVRDARKRIAAAPDERAEIEKRLVMNAEEVVSRAFPRKGEMGGVYVLELAGPRGPVYQTTIDGNHRIAAARLINLKRVRGEVKRIASPELAAQYWGDLMASLDVSDRRSIMEVYDKIYGPPSDEQKHQEAERLQQAERRQKSIQQTAARLWEEEDRHFRQLRQQEEEEASRLQDHYRRTEQRYDEIKDQPAFKAILAQAGYDYLMHHEDDYVRRSFPEPVSVDEDGYFRDTAGENTFVHIFQIDLDAYPRHTKNEIIALAVERFEKR